MVRVFKKLLIQFRGWFSKQLLTLVKMAESDLAAAAEIWPFRPSAVCQNGPKRAVTGVEIFFGKWGVISKGEVQATQERPNF